MPPNILDGLSLKDFAESVLPFRSSEHVAAFCEKLLGEGIAAPGDLLITSKEALETKLSTHAAFSLGEMADTISLRSAVERLRRAAASGAGADEAGGRVRSRSPAPKAESRGGRRQRRGGGARSCAQRKAAAPAPKEPRPAPKELRPQSCGRPGAGPKPDLWQAVERGDEEAVRALLEKKGCDIEERYQTWSPLMKAAEEGHVEILRLLLGTGADIEAANRKGRTALSFAAAPSGPRTPSAGALRLLLQHGADTSRKDVDGLTAKARAARENRAEALAVLEEFEGSR